MPRCNPLTADAKIQTNIKKLTREVKHNLDDAGITYTRMAEVLNISPQAVSQQFRSGRLTAEAYIASEMLIKGEL